MSYFYGSTQGNRGETTRGGSKRSGLRSTANGWSFGGEVSIHYDSALDTDVVTFYTTNGSNSSRSRVMSFALIDGKRVILDTAYPETLI